MRPSLSSAWLPMALALLGLGAGHARPGSSITGPASGLWDFGSGTVLGTFDSIDGGPTPYALQATLAPYPVMCPACLVGTVHGTLDDGRGASPDYIVDGGYGGETFNGGTGAFQLHLRKPGGAPAGTLRGSFESGSFVGRYSLRP